MVNDPSLIVSTFIGIFLPLVVAFLNSPTAGRRWKTLITAVACVIAALLSLVLTDKLINTVGVHGVALAKLYLENLLLTLITAWTFYEHFWKPNGTTAALEATGARVGG